MGLKEIATQDDVFRLWVTEHISALETQMTTFASDGQPGRTALVEERVRAVEVAIPSCLRERLGNVERRLWSFAGAAALAAFLFHYIIRWLGFR